MPIKDINKKEKMYIDFGEVQDLFIIFRRSDNEHNMTNLIKYVSPWLFNIVYQLVADEDIAETILNKTYKKFIENYKNYNPDEHNILYELFLIAKNYTLQVK
jgi:hypothetical protein